MSVLTPARVGLARAGATRAGYPIAQGLVLPTYALAAVARSGATRANYHAPQTFASLAGVHIGTAPAVDAQRILHDTLTISDALGATPTTGACTTKGFLPSEGQEILLTLGSKNNLRRIFAGTILSSTLGYVGTPAAYHHALRLIDYTWGLGTRTIRARYTSTTVGIIAADLVAIGAPGYTLHVTADMAAEPIDEITFTDQDLPAALSQLMARAAGDWRCDAHRVVRLFHEDTSETPPTILNAVHPSLTHLQMTRDLSQLLTRVYVEGGGVTAFATLAVGETILPLDGDPGWYEAGGGVVVCGPQRLTYSGVAASSGGGLVGVGAAPSGAPSAALVSGTGIESGAHDYAVTFTTAAGESIAGPRATITPGLVPAPLTAPTAGAATAGTGPNAGSHDYAVTFVTASGETTAGPSVTAATGEIPAPTVSPTIGTPFDGPGPDAGTHEYAVSFVTAAGETRAGPISALVATDRGPDDPPSVSTTLLASGTAGLLPGTYTYAYTNVTAAGESQLSPTSGLSVLGTAPPTAPVTSWNSGTSGGPLSAGDYLWAYTFVTLYGESTISPLYGPYTVTAGSFMSPRVPVGPSGTTARKYYRTVANGSVLKLVATIADNVTTDIADTTADGSLGANAPGGLAIVVSGIAVGPTGTTARTVYRTTAGGATYQLQQTIPNNTATTAVADVMPDADLGVVAPTTDTSGLAASIPLTAIPLGAVGTTGRQIYRRSAGLGLKLAATIANNSSTTHTDVTPNASLGAAPPSVTTATLNVIPLTAIPTGSALVTSRNIYRTAVGSAQLKLLATLADNTTTGFSDTVVDASLGANVPTSNTATANRVTLSAIPIGAASVTSRKLYRTAVGSAQLKLLATLADNVTATYADLLADATLGANVPVTDTSGLTQPQGNVVAGSTSLQVASIGPFPAAGWAVIGNGQQVIRYTGIAGNVLTGIPASGAGAILASIAFNSTVTAAPALLGIPASGPGSIRYPILRGDNVNLLVQVDDVPAQTALAALLTTPTFTSDGIQDDTVQDRRLSHREALARGQARLVERRDVHVTLRYQVRDLNTIAGALVTVNLGPPFSLPSVEFRIQQVTISGFVPALFPVRDVTASSIRFSFEEFLRAIKKAV